MPLPTSFAKENAQDFASDFLFFIQYAPKGFFQLTKYTLVGATLGWCTSYSFNEALQQFAKEHHEAVDLTGAYVPDDAQFLHFSRNQHFNQKEAPISEMLPFYSASVGAAAGLFFGGNKIYHHFIEKLEADREEREARKIPV